MTERGADGTMLRFPGFLRFLRFLLVLPVGLRLPGLMIGADNSFVLTFLVPLLTTLTLSYSRPLTCMAPLASNQLN